MAAILNLRYDSCQSLSLLSVGTLLSLKRKIHYCIVHHWVFTLLDIMMPYHSEINVKKASTDTCSRGRYRVIAEILRRWITNVCGLSTPMNRSKRISKFPRVLELLKKVGGVQLCTPPTLRKPNWLLISILSRECKTVVSVFLAKMS